MNAGWNGAQLLSNKLKLKKTFPEEEPTPSLSLATIMSNRKFPPSSKYPISLLKMWDSYIFTPLTCWRSFYYSESFFLFSPFLHGLGLSSPLHASSLSTPLLFSPLYTCLIGLSCLHCILIAIFQELMYFLLISKYFGYFIWDAFSCFLCIAATAASWSIWGKRIRSWWKGNN